MKVREVTLLLIALLLLPSVVTAATLRADQSLMVSDTEPGNAYLAGSDIEVQAPVLGDLVVAGTRILVNASILGDILGVGGNVQVNAPVSGDVRVAGWHITLTKPVDGEVALFGGVIKILETAHEIRVAGATVEVQKGATGPVTIYGSHVSLAGEFSDDVRVVSADQVILAPNTIIHGAFEYNAPQQASIPDSAVVDGGVQYVGSASFLPTVEEAKTFAVAGLGIFFVVRIIAAMVTAGLLAGLFPVFTRKLAKETLGHSTQRFMFLLILGFGIVVAVPILFVLLIVSVVGIGVALLIGSAYLFLLFLAYLYSAVLAGSALSRLILKKNEVSWHHAVVGMLALYVVGLIPGIGFLVTLILLCTAVGALTYIFYQFAFPKSELHG